MRLDRKILIIVGILLLTALNLKLGMAVFHTRQENKKLVKKLRILLEKQKECEDAFYLKQDHMRRILTDQDFVEQILREKKELFREKETIIRFEN